MQDVVYTPIKANATRVAALISGEVDFVLDPPPTDMPRLRTTPGVKVIDGPENRIIFIGMDQGRDELLYSNVKGKNPFKDKRVRQALYQAVDIEAIKTKLMRGQAAPTGATMPSPLGDYNDPELEKRLPYDLAAAKKLMAAAGYPNGFEVTLDCPNNRYVNDEEICKTLAAMWARLEREGPRQRDAARDLLPEAREARHLDVHAGLGRLGDRRRDHADADLPHPRHAAASVTSTTARSSDPKLDELAAASSREPDPKKREALVKAAIKRYNDQVYHIPLHRQFIPWAARDECRRRAPRRQLARIRLGHGEVTDNASEVQYWNSAAMSRRCQSRAQTSASLPPGCSRRRSCMPTRRAARSRHSTSIWRFRASA